MTDVLLLPKSLNTKDKPLARIIPIRFIADKKTKSEIKVKEKEEKEPTLFYKRPIFKANKYEFY
jgi:hypothetical protein